MWTLIAINLSKPWIDDLSIILNHFWAVFIVSGIALIPGFMNIFLIVSLLLDKQPELNNYNADDDITLLISAFNEEIGIFNTLKYVSNQNYNGNIHTIVIDNNSNDKTGSEVKRAMKELNMDILLLSEPTPGKFNALNHGLNHVNTEFVITLDADTLIHKNAIRNLVGRIKSSSGEVCAVAGSMLVRNSRDNWLFQQNFHTS
ncbi:hypothetical protein AVM15_04555 [Paraclostridium benzoelyticum]|nr:hypothetical protein AVM15_04555 [Paraclostridium benzoelyticum]